MNSGENNRTRRQQNRTREEARRVLRADESSTYDVAISDTTGDFEWIGSTANCEGDACEEARQKAWNWCLFEDPEVYQVVDLESGEKRHTRPPITR